MIELRRESHWDVLYKSMKDVVHGKWGTARATGWGMKFKMAGKTGTAQVFGIAQDEEYDAETVAKKLRDHGLFIGFGPVEDPVLAVAVVAENGEHGSAMAPIARDLIKRFIEKYSDSSAATDSEIAMFAVGSDDAVGHEAHAPHERAVH
jgi:penicillin-binding protein 2